MIESILSTHQFSGDDYDAMCSATHVDASAVSNLYFSYPNESWSILDFPPIVPPFQNLWIEFEAPQKVALYGGEIVKWPYDKAPSMWGAMVRTYETKLFDCLRLSDANLSGLTVRRGNYEAYSAADELTKWSIVVDLYTKDSGCDPGHRFRRGYAISEDGRLVMTPFGSLSTGGELSTGAPSEFEREGDGLITMIFLALSFMNCRNVSLINKPVHAREARLFVKKHGRPMVQYKTLVIDHMKRILRNSEHGSGKSLKRAMHGCRGYFAHYSKERPLFGKYPGTFWVPPHVRGTETVGIVEKDYLVR